MAHWAEIDENNIVLRVTVGNNDAPDEGYQWLIDNLGGTWLKCSYNTIDGVHLQGGTPFRWTYPGPGFSYYEDVDSFIAPSEYKGWLLDKETKTWFPPLQKPDSGFWKWDNDSESWVESDNEYDF